MHRSEHVGDVGQARRLALRIGVLADGFEAGQAGCGTTGPVIEFPDGLELIIVQTLSHIELLAQLSADHLIDRMQGRPVTGSCCVPGLVQTKVPVESPLRSASSSRCTNDRRLLTVRRSLMYHLSVSGRSGM